MTMSTYITKHMEVPTQMTVQTIRDAMAGMRVFSCGGSSNDYEIICGVVLLYQPEVVFAGLFN